MQKSAERKEKTSMTLDSKVHCPNCDDTGYIVLYRTYEYLSGKYENWIECPHCKQVQKQRVHDMQQASDVPSAFYNSRMKDFDWDIYKGVPLQRPAALVHKFITEFDKWQKQGLGLYIYSGMKGSGKTFLASCICNELTEKGVATKFVSANDLIRLDSIDSSDGKHIIEGLCNAKVLVLDDLMSKEGKGGNWLSEILFRITDYRMIHKKVTIFTSNLPLSELQIDDRVLDRINRMVVPMTLPNQCIRSLKAKDETQQFLTSLGL